MTDGGLRKVKRAHYVQIDNETARDTRLSYRALGVLTELVSHEEGWIVRAADMAKTRKEGRDAIETALRELRAAGYYRVERRRAPSGKWTTGGAVADYPIPQWAEDHKRHPRGIPVAVLADGTVVDIDDSGSPDTQELGEPEPGNPGSVTENGFPGPGKATAGNPVSLEDHPEHHPEGSDARSASTANPVDPPQQQQAYVPRERDDAAATDSMDHTPALAGRDAPRAANTDPAAILDAAMLNPYEADQFRTWLRERTGATNPDGLVVQLHRSGDLSARIIQWRSDSHTQPPAGVQTPPPARTAWCGLCDRSTRLTMTHDEHGHELVRRCPDCHPASGHTPPGAGAAARLAQDAQLVAANNTGTGRAAYQAARAKLPTGARRRVTTHLTQEADPS